MQNGQLINLSEEQLVDCGPDNGCEGGSMDDGFNWVQQNGGLCREEDYPYKMGNWAKGDPIHGTCKRSCSPVPGTVVDHITDVEETEEALMNAISS